jgi:hypothetical protein
MRIRNNSSMNQKGVISIIVTMIIMIVLTLIVTGFSQIARNEQREALDRQLSTQASYAAETGINDARRAIAAGFTGEKTSCGPIPEIAGNTNTVGDNIGYSCLLIKQILPDPKLGNVTPTESSVLPLNAVDAAGVPKALNNLFIEWKSKDTSKTVIPSLPLGRFLPANTWNSSNYFGVLRVDLIPAGVLSADALQNGTYTVFIYPTSGALQTYGYTNIPAEQGQVRAAQCNTAQNTCRVNINGLNQTNYFIRVKSLYETSEVKLCGTSACSASTSFKGAQAEIDSTGKANDQLKRIKVRVNDVSELSNTKTLPNYAFDSAEDVCKKLSVYPGGADLGGCL